MENFGNTDEAFKAEMREKSAEELRETAETFREMEWDNQAEVAEAVLQEEKGKPTDPDSDVVDEDIATLEDKLELFEEQGWKSNADRVRAELERKQGLDSSEELDHAEDDLTHSEELDDGTIEIKVAKFFSSGDKFRDVEDLSESEQQAIEDSNYDFGG